MAKAFLASPAALDKFAQVDTLPLNGAYDAGVRARSVKMLQKPNGLRLLQTQVYSSPTYYRWASSTQTTAGVRTVPASGADLHPAGLPLGPGWDLGTRWTLLVGRRRRRNSSPQFRPEPTARSGRHMNFSVRLWWRSITPRRARSRTSGIHRHQSRRWPPYPRPAHGSCDPTELPLRSVVNNGAVTTTPVPSLPGSDKFMQLSAGSDGTIWALGTSGTPYSYSASSKSWTKQATGGMKITTISVGSATNIWALGTASGSTTSNVLQWVGGSFQVDPYFTSKGGAQLISATADGSAWVVSSQTLYSRAYDVGAWSQVTAQTPPGTITSLSGVSKFRVNANTGAANLYLLSYGLADQPATGYPAMDAGELAGYNYISNMLAPGTSGGIRADYDNSNMVSNVSGWASAILTLSLQPAPAGISAMDWSSITTQLHNETTYVNDVNDLFTNIGTLTQQIQTAGSAELGIDAGLVQLSNDQQNSTFDAYLEATFEAALWGFAASGLAPGTAVAASMVASGVGSWLSSISGTPNPNAQTSIQTTQINLASQLLQMYTTANTSNGVYHDSILSDWGRLSVVGAAIGSGAVKWDFSTVPTIAHGTDVGFDTYFIKTLMPIKWNAVAYSGDSIYSYIYDHVPQYDLYFLSSVFHGQQLVSGDFRFIHDQNGANNPIFSYAGPFPDQRC